MSRVIGDRSKTAPQPARVASAMSTRTAIGKPPMMTIRLTGDGQTPTDAGTKTRAEGPFFHAAKGSKTRLARAANSAACLRAAGMLPYGSAKRQTGRPPFQTPSRTFQDFGGIDSRRSPGGNQGPLRMRPRTEEAARLQTSRDHAEQFQRAELSGFAPARLTPRHQARHRTDANFAPSSNTMFRMWYHRAPNARRTPISWLRC